MENNNSFYRLPPRETFESWRDRTPDDFVMAVKASRYLTHVRRLRDPAEPAARLLAAAAGLGAKLGPVLLQLPPTLQADPGTRLAEAWPDEADVYVYFNNDPGGAAVVNSVQFAELARQAGRGVTRVPAAEELAGLSGG